MHDALYDDRFEIAIYRRHASRKCATPIMISSFFPRWRQVIPLPGYAPPPPDKMKATMIRHILLFLDFADKRYFSIFLIEMQTDAG